MATSKIYGTAVTNKYNNKNYTWKDWTWVTIPDNYADPSVTSVTITWAVKFCFTSHGSGSNLSISGTRAHASLTVNDATASTFNQDSTAHKLYGGEANAWQVISYSKTIVKTNQPQTVTWSSWCKIDSGSTWKGTSTISTQTFTVPALASYTVSYNANDGTGTIADDTKWFGEDLTLSDGSGFTRTNYTLVGWNTAADGSGTHYDLGDTYSTNGALTLYAEWELNALQVKTKVSGTWYPGFAYVKVNGTWYQAIKGYVKVNGTWYQLE